MIQFTVIAEEELLTFTDVFGQEIEARIVKVESGQVYLEERDGGKLNLSPRSLPEEEQEWVRNWIANALGRRLPDGCLLHD